MDYAKELARMKESYSVTNEKLLQQINCVGCMKVCSSPITLCKNGHNVCGCCPKKENHECPLCSDFPLVPNPVAEFLLANVLRPCVNKIIGCATQFVSADLAKHLEVCDYRFQCKIETCVGERVSRCEWMGQKSALLQHCKEDHGNHYVESNELDMLCLLGEDNDLYNPNLMSCYGELFWVIAFYSDNFVNFYARFVGEDDRAKLYKCEFKFSSEDGLCEATCKSGVLTLNENSVMNSKSIQLNEYMMQRFTAERKLRAHATILRV